MEANCEEPLDPLELYYEGISTLNKKQLPYMYIRYAFGKGLFTVAAKDVIKEHMAFTMNETEDDDSDGGHGHDDDDDDGNGDNVEDDPDGSTSDSDAVREISSSE